MSNRMHNDYAATMLSQTNNYHNCHALIAKVCSYRSDDVFYGCGGFLRVVATGIVVVVRVQVALL